jgi:heterodisulfide reductase subunit A
LILASAVVPGVENPLAQLYKVPQNQEGFFAEAHVKLRPVDFTTDGVFLCGLAHAPKSIDESITQAQAAAARAVSLLSEKKKYVSGAVAHINQVNCSGCGIYVSICPYPVLELNKKTGKSEIQSVLCKGCGLCVASCRSGAVDLNGFDTPQIMAMIESSLSVTTM